MAVDNVPDPLPTQQVIALNYQALFTNLANDDAFNRQKRRKERIAPLVEKLDQLEPDFRRSLGIAG